MEEVAETHMYTRKFCKLAYITIFFTNNYLDCKRKEIYNHFKAYICVLATCMICGRSGTNLTMAISKTEIFQMLRKLGSRVIHKCRLQICDQISQIDNNLFVIRYTIYNWLINILIN